jgi:hypothetical protein
MRYAAYTTLVACDTCLIIACAAIDGAIILGQEWNLRLYATLSANNRMHLSWSAFGTTCVPTRIAACGTTGRAASGLVHQTFLLVELLFACGEYEIGAAFTAFQGFVNEVQLGPPCDMLVVLRVISLAESPVVLSPYQRGIKRLDRHCTRDRDRIPRKSIHYYVVLFKAFAG